MFKSCTLFLGKLFLKTPVVHHISPKLVNVYFENSKNKSPVILNLKNIATVKFVVNLRKGENIADEYINKASRFGYWKDNAVMLEGDAVWSFTVMFLTMWDYIEGNKNCGDYSRFKPDYLKQNVESPGFVQPYTDNPLDNEPLGENIYIGMIETAKKYLWRRNK